MTEVNPRNFLGLDKIFNQVANVIITDVSDIVMQYLTSLTGKHVRDLNFDMEIIPRKFSKIPRAEVCSKGVIVIDYNQYINLFDTNGKLVRREYGRKLVDGNKFFWDDSLIMAGVYSDNQHNPIYGIYTTDFDDIKNNDVIDFPLSIQFKHEPIAFSLDKMTLYNKYMFTVKLDKLVAIHDSGTTHNIFTFKQSKLVALTACDNELFTLSDKGCVIVFDTKSFEVKRFLFADSKYEWNNIYVMRDEIIVTTVNMMSIYNKFDGSLIISRMISQPIGTDGKHLYVYNKTGMTIYG